MLTILVVVLSILIGLVIAGLIFLAWEKITWLPAAKITAHRGTYINILRQPGERLSAYERRVDLGWKELLDAGDEFLVAVMKEGTCVQSSERCFELQLPINHPAAIRYLKAKGQI